MYNVTNTTNDYLAVPGYPAFSPNEVREVTEEDAKILGNSPVLQVTEAKAQPKPKDLEPEGEESEAEEPKTRAKSKK